MRFENQENFDMGELPEVVDSEYVTSQVMDALWDMVIEPMADNLNDHDRKLISLMGITLKLVAHKAKLYEEMSQGNLPENFLN
jgi:hypothetical protein